MSFTNSSKIITLVYIFSSLFWLYILTSTKHTESSLGYYFQIPLAIVPLLGGTFGLLHVRSWGGLQSAMGKALFGLSTGLLTWGSGMVIWNYYIFFTHIEVPFPSLADAIFILSWFFWPYGIYELSKATGAKFGLRLIQGKVSLVFIPLIAIALSYYLLIEVARGGGIDFSVGGLHLFFDLFYPLGTFAILTMVSIVYSLSRKFLGGKFKKPVLLLFVGFLLNYFSDFIFAYTTSIETYFNGHFVDFLFLTSMSILSIAVISLKPYKK